MHPATKTLWILTVYLVTSFKVGKGEPTNLPIRRSLDNEDLSNKPYIVQNHYAINNAIHKQTTNGDEFDGNKVLDAKVFCDLRANIMTIEFKFAKKFTGFAYTKGYYKINECKTPGEGIEALTFTFPLDGCGTTIRSQGEYQNNQIWYQNTVIIMYETYLGILESYDRSFDLRCELDDKIKKVASHVTVPMLASKAIGFKLEMPNVWMKLVSGKDPSSPPSPYLTIGEIGTMVIVMENQSNRFDFFAFQCSAHDGSGKSHVILLNDVGCPVHRKLVGPQQYDKLKSLEMVSFTHFKVFKFPDIENVYMECFVKICFQKCPRERCLDENGNNRRYKRAMDASIKSNATAIDLKGNDSVEIKTYQSVSVHFPGTTYMDSNEEDDNEAELTEVQENGTLVVPKYGSTNRGLKRKGALRGKLLVGPGRGVEVNHIKRGICFSFLPFVVFVSVHSALFIISASFAIFLSIRFKICASLLKSSSSADLASVTSKEKLMCKNNKFVKNAIRPPSKASPQISYVQGPFGGKSRYSREVSSCSLIKTQGGSNASESSLTNSLKSRDSLITKEENHRIGEFFGVSEILSLDLSKQTLHTLKGPGEKSNLEEKDKL